MGLWSMISNYFVVMVLYCFDVCQYTVFGGDESHDIVSLYALLSGEPTRTTAHQCSQTLD